MMQQDQITFEILEDGTIKASTDAVSMPNHVSAEQLLKGVAALTDGQVNRTRKHGHAHVHHHGQVRHSH